ncbi:nickel insertion protein [Fodinisporobacter ferrooxydans]|uniref:nickel insertion protein n=1 Tax=Fodinisporobacter ferrooxydans TaxID=2901836 RepID=UPI003242BAE3
MESICILEAQIDDSSGEMMGYAMERLFAAGALDVYYTPVYMKKNRPGVLISVLVLEDHANRCEEILLMETTTIGVRRSIWKRRKLDRRIVTVATSFGEIRIKQALWNGRIVNQAPEYEDVAQASRKHCAPFKVIYWDAMKYGEIEE